MDFLSQLRLQGLMNPDTYGVNDPFKGTSFNSPAPEDPFQTSNAMSGVSFAPPKVRTQDSVFADQSKGQKEHPAVSDAYNRIKAMFDSYTPDTQANDRLNKLLENTPQINTPSLGRKFVAAGAALGNIGPHFTSTGGGADASDRVLYAPYLQQMAAFKEKAGPFQAAATGENARNIQERTLLSGMIQAQAKADEDQARSDDADKKNAILQQNADTARKAAEAKAANDTQRTLLAQAMANGAKPQVINGHLFAFHPSTGEASDLGSVTNETAIILQGMKDASALAVQGSRNAGGLARQNSANEGALATAQQRGQDAQTVAGMRSGGYKPMPPAAVATDRLNKVQDILAHNKDLAPYIEIQGRTITMTPPEDGWIFAVNPKLKAAYDAARDTIFAPQQTPQLNPNFGNNIPNVKNTPAPKDNTQWKYQQDPTDKTNREMRRVSPDGKRTQYSHDGGINWGPQ